MTLVFLDTETTGLDPDKDSVWEIAYAVDDGPILSSFVTHRAIEIGPRTLPALRVNRYVERYTYPPASSVANERNRFETKLRFEVLKGATIVGSNPSFDTAFLRTRWNGDEPWHHRKIDISTYALPLYGEMLGLYKIAERLEIQAPDHTAAVDVAVLRDCFYNLRDIYSGWAL